MVVAKQYALIDTVCMFVNVIVIRSCSAFVCGEVFSGKLLSLDEIFKCVLPKSDDNVSVV